MAKKSPRILIAEALEDLSTEDLCRFTARMRERRDDGIKPERFRKGQVENKNYQQLADLLVDAFAADAVSITVKLLRAIDSNQVADDLEFEARSLPASNSQGCGAATDHKEHFVDRHRSALIARVSNMSPVLDVLLDKKVVGQEQYDTAMKMVTSQDQMRFLFSGPLKAGEHSKDVLLAALEEQNPFLIEDLRNAQA